MTYIMLELSYSPCTFSLQERCKCLYLFLGGGKCKQSIGVLLGRCLLTSARRSFHPLLVVFLRAYDLFSLLSFFPCGEGMPLSNCVATPRSYRRERQCFAESFRCSCSELRGGSRVGRVHDKPCSPRCQWLRPEKRKQSILAACKQRHSLEPFGAPFDEPVFLVAPTLIH